MGTCRVLEGQRMWVCLRTKQRESCWIFLDTTHQGSGARRPQQQWSAAHHRRPGRQASPGSDWWATVGATGMRWNDPEGVLQRLMDAWCKKFSFYTFDRPGSTESVFRDPCSSTNSYFLASLPTWRGQTQAKVAQSQPSPENGFKTLLSFNWYLGLQTFKCLS